MDRYWLSNSWLRFIYWPVTFCGALAALLFSVVGQFITSDDPAVTDSINNFALVFLIGPFAWHGAWKYRRDQFMSVFDAHVQFWLGLFPFIMFVIPSLVAPLFIYRAFHVNWTLTLG